MFVGDGTRVRQILYNLLSNAVKFTATGEIVVTADVVRRSGRDGASLELILAVRDTGIGVPADKLDQIFRPFTQADGSTTRRYGGAGLGLSVAAQLAELLKGAITVESQPGAGSTFTARLHVAPAEPVAEADAASPPSSVRLGSRLRVLAAEDSPTNQLVLRGLLGAVGAEATVVENGLAAIEAWAAREFDFILLDIQMPVMDGVAAAREIRRLEAETGRERTPIIAVSANAMTHQVESYLAAGMDGHIPKPLKPTDFVEALHRFATLPDQPAIDRAAAGGA
jgi:CheY-like chemotaxis protein